MSTLPAGAGLSSSAALELASAWACRQPAGPADAPLDVARIAQRAENEYVGMRCGLMDQFASACGVAGAAVLLDCRTLEHRAGARCRDDLVIVRRPHRRATDARWLGVQRAAGRMRASRGRAAPAGAVRSRVAGRRPGHARAAPSGLDPVAASAPGTSSRRTPGCCRPSRRWRPVTSTAVGRLFAASHASLRDLFEVSCPELDVLVEIAVEHAGRGRGTHDRGRLRRLHRGPGAARTRWSGSGRASSATTRRGRAGPPAVAGARRRGSRRRCSN